MKPSITSLTLHERVLCEQLRQMRLSGMAEALEAQLLDPNADLRSAMERIEDIVTQEWQLRYNKKFKKFLKRATLRYPQADFDDSLYDPVRKLDTNAVQKLATCQWIEQGKNLLITGATGTGKSYLSNALCIAALRQFKTVRYVRACHLMDELAQARDNKTYLEFEDEIAKLDLLVIDDFGLMELDLDKCRDLLNVIDSRDQRHSTMVVSQFPVEKWYDFFVDHTYADACLDRLTDRKYSYRLEMYGPSRRNSG